MPHRVLHTLSVQRVPILCHAVRAFEYFLTAWEALKEGPRGSYLAPYIDEGLRWAGKYYKKLDDTSAYVIAMCTSIIYQRHVLLFALPALTHW